MRNTNPLVSIVTPSYNQAKFLRENLSSVKNQSYPKIEHHVIDGGSEDGTVELLKNHQANYNLNWVSESDGGQSDAINKGFRLSKGEIVGWLNSDDLYFSSQVIQLVVKHFTENSRLDVLYGHCAVIDSQGNLRRVKVAPTFNRWLLKRWNFVQQPTVFFLREVLEDQQLDLSYDMSMDYEFWLRLSRKFGFGRLDKILAADRNHSQRKLVTRKRDSLNESARLRQKYGVQEDLVTWITRSLSILLFWRIAGLGKLKEVCSTRTRLAMITVPKLSKYLSTQLWGKELHGWGDFKDD